VLSVENVTLMLECLNILVMNKVSRPIYLNLAPLYLSVSCFGCFFLRLILSKTDGSYLLLVMICCITFFHQIARVCIINSIVLVVNCCHFMFSWVARVVWYDDVRSCRFSVGTY
jgi:hypothetical protein